MKCCRGHVLGGASRRAKRGGERGIISSDETKQVTG